MVHKESQTHKAFRKAFRGKGHIVRIENAIGIGTPDIEYCFEGVAGWVEVEEVHWPRSLDSVVEFPHLTQEQKLFLTQRALSAGNAFVLAHVQNKPNYYFLYRGANILSLGKMTAKEITDDANYSNHNSIENMYPELITREPLAKLGVY